MEMKRFFSIANKADSWNFHTKFVVPYVYNMAVSAWYLCLFFFFFELFFQRVVLSHSQCFCVQIKETPRFTQRDQHKYLIIYIRLGSSVAFLCRFGEFRKIVRLLAEGRGERSKKSTESVINNRTLRDPIIIIIIINIPDETESRNGL